MALDAAQLGGPGGAGQGGTALQLLLQPWFGPETATGGAGPLETALTAGLLTAQQGHQVVVGVGEVAHPLQQNQREGSLPQLAVGGGGLHAGHLELDAVAQILAQLGLPGQGKHPISGNVGAEGQRQAEPLALAVAGLAVEGAGPGRAVAGPGGGVGALEAGGHQIPQRRSQAQGDPAADGGPIEAVGHGLAQPGIVEGRLVGEQGEIADLQGWPAALLQLACRGAAAQGRLLVDLQAGGEQHVHFAALQGAEQGGGITEGHEVDAAVGGSGPPVAGEGLQPLLLVGKEAEPVGPCADEAVVEEALAVIAVGAGREGREVDGAEQLCQGAEGALEGQLERVGPHGPHPAHPIPQQITELADRQEALQGEHHGRSVEGRAVVEEHALAQLHPGRQPIGTDLGRG